MSQELTAHQTAFLALPHFEALYGGAAGGGKSQALLDAALQYVDVPGYAAMIFRRTYPDLSTPGALMDRATEMLSGTDARWNGQRHTWTFPSGAVLGFGSCQYDNDRYKYKGMEVQFLGFDELTEFNEVQYRFLQARVRRTKGLGVPLRVRSASNPGGVGHDWVKRRFMPEGEVGNPERPFIPARLDDNPYLDRDSYRAILEGLDPITRAHLLDGDWSARQVGSVLKREWFGLVEEAPAETAWVRYWDFAATAPKPGKDPDYTAGAKVGLHDGVWYIADIRRTQSTPGGVEDLVKQTAILDGRGVAIRSEEEGGASGKGTTDHYAREVLVGWDYAGIRSTGSKLERSRIQSSAAQAGNIKLIGGGAWIGDYLDEAEGFPDGSHDDQIDAVDGGMGYLADGAMIMPDFDRAVLSDERVSIGHGNDYRGRDQRVTSSGMEWATAR